MQERFSTIEMHERKKKHYTLVDAHVSMMKIVSEEKLISYVVHCLFHEKKKKKNNSYLFHLFYNFTRIHEKQKKLFE